MIPLDFREYPLDEMRQRAVEFYECSRARRTVRQFSSRVVPREIIETCIGAAGTAPSGANQQPWHFVAVANRDTKHRIRLAAEREEQVFYDHLAPDEWLAALEPLGTDDQKPFLEEAPWLIAIFVERFSHDERGDVVKHYYPVESVGIATGILITALHQAGLATLTHTPSPMKFLNEILTRPENERPFLLLVAGYPTEDAQVPDIAQVAGGHLHIR